MTAITTKLATRRGLQERIAELEEERDSDATVLRGCRAEIERLTISLRHERQLERTIAESIAAGIRAELDTIAGQLAVMNADHDQLVAAHRSTVQALVYIERLATDVDESGVVDDPADRLQQIYEACLATHFTRWTVRT